jgi:hypothetical protein
LSFSDWGESTGLDRRKLLVIVVSVIVGGGALILMLAMLFNKNNAPAQAAPAPAGTAVGDAAQEAAQPLEPLVAPPANVTWSPHNSTLHPGVVTAVPTSPEHGPRTDTESFAAGYERSTAGALIAATQIATRFGESPTQNSYVTGPGKDEALAQVTGSSSESGQDTFQGFRVLGQPTDQQVLLELLIGRGAGFQPSACTLELRWADNDWRIYAATSAICLSIQQAVSPSDRASYVEWGPG